MWMRVPAKPQMSKLELQTTASCLTWVLGTQLMSSVRTARALNCRASFVINADAINICNQLKNGLKLSTVANASCPRIQQNYEFRTSWAIQRGREGEGRAEEEGEKREEGLSYNFPKLLHSVPFPLVGYVRSPIFPHLYQYCHYEFLALEYCLMTVHSIIIHPDIYQLQGALTQLTNFRPEECSLVRHDGAHL